jgi:DNA-binding transcriptional MocR family regulator
MSAIAMKWAWAVRDADPISPTAHHVLLCLADRFNPKYGVAWPSYADITRRTGLSERTVRRAIDELEDSGLVVKSPRVATSGRKVGLEYGLPRLDHDLEAERQSADFASDGAYDASLADENEQERREEQQDRALGATPVIPELEPNGDPERIAYLRSNGWAV